MIIIMLGAPATGKGSVAALLSEKYNIPAISSGDIFRKHISEKTEIGEILNSYMSKGNLVPDEIVLRMLKERLEEDDVKNGAILDVFIGTSEKVQSILEEKGSKIDIVVNLETPEDEILERIVNRRVCTNKACKTTYNTVLSPSKVEGICDKCGSSLEQRSDDTLESAKNRLKVYHEETYPLVDYYGKTGALYSTTLSARINRMKNEVVADVVEHLDNK